MYSEPGLTAKLQGRISKGIRPDTGGMHSNRPKGDSGAMSSITVTLLNWETEAQKGEVICPISEGAQSS